MTLLVVFTVVMVGIVSAFMVTSQQWNEVRRQQRVIDASYAEEQVKLTQLRQLEEQRAELVDKAEVTTALIDRVPRSVLMAELVTRMPSRVTLLELDLVSKRIRATTPPVPTGGAQGRASGGVRSISGSTRTAAPQRGATRGRPGAQPAAAEARPRVEPPRFESTLTLVGVATVNNDIADYLSALKDCPLLQNVELSFIQTTVIDSVERRKFEIQARLRADADATLVALAQPAHLVGLPTPGEIGSMPLNQRPEPVKPETPAPAGAGAPGSTAGAPEGGGEGSGAVTDVPATSPSGGAGGPGGVQ